MKQKRKNHTSSGAAISAQLQSASNENNNTVNIFQSTDAKLLRENILQKLQEMYAEVPRVFQVSLDEFKSATAEVDDKQAAPSPTSNSNSTSAPDSMPVSDLSLASVLKPLSNSISSHQIYLTQFDLLEMKKVRGEKLLIPGKDGQQEVEFNTENLLKLLDVLSKEVTDGEVDLKSQSVSIDDKKEFLNKVAKAIGVCHYTYRYIVQYDKNALKQQKQLKEELFEQFAFMVDQLNLLEDSSSSVAFAREFFTEHNKSQSKITDHYVLIVNTYLNTTMYHIYTNNTEAVKTQEKLLGENFVKLAVELYNYSRDQYPLAETVKAKNDHASNMTLAALYQAIYSCNFSLSVRKNENNNNHNLAFSKGAHIERAASNVSIKSHWSKNLTALALLKQAFRAYKNISPEGQDHYSRQSLSLIIEMTVKVMQDLNAATMNADGLIYRDERDYFNAIKANISLLNEMIYVAQNDINKFHKGLEKAEALVLLYNQLIKVLDTEFVNKSKAAKESEELLIKSEKGKSRQEGNTKKPSKKSQTRLPKNNLDQDSESENSIIPVKMNSRSNEWVGYDDALALLRENKHSDALKKFDIVKAQTRIKPEIKAKTLVNMAECHIAIASQEISKRPLMRCFKKKMPVADEVKSAFNNIIDHVQKALDLCEKSKESINSLSLVERNNLFSNIELVLISVSKVFGEIEKERQSYISNMNMLKKSLKKSGYYGENINTDPHHLTSNGVKWCKRIGPAIQSIDSLVSVVQEKVEGSYQERFYHADPSASQMLNADFDKVKNMIALLEMSQDESKEIDETIKAQQLLFELETQKGLQKKSDSDVSFASYRDAVLNSKKTTNSNEASKKVLETSQKTPETPQVASEIKPVL